MQSAEVTHVQRRSFHCYEPRRLHRQPGWHSGLAAVPEASQRVVAMTAIQFMLFEPEGRVKGNDELKVAAEKLIDIIITQLKTLKTKKSDW